MTISSLYGVTLTVFPRTYKFRAMCNLTPVEAILSSRLLVSSTCRLHMQVFPFWVPRINTLAVQALISVLSISAFSSCTFQCPVGLKFGVFWHKSCMAQFIDILASLLMSQYLSLHTAQFLIKFTTPDTAPNVKIQHVLM